MEKLEYKKNGTSKKKRTAAPKTETKKSNKGKVQKKKVHTSSKKTVRKELVKVKRKKMSKKKLTIIFIIVFLLILITLGVLAVTLPTFNVESFLIEGSQKYSTDEIVEKSGLKTGENIFIQLFKGVSRNIGELPYVKKVDISIIWPNKLDIKITERECAYFAFDKDTNKFYKIDSEGYILEEGIITEKKSNELLTYGFIFDDEVVLGSKLKDVDISKICIYNNVKAEFDKSGISGSITKVNFENSLTTITLNDKLNVIFPNDTDIEYKMSFFKSILAKIGEDSVGIIDMTKTDPVFSSF